jgi:aspartate-semialdehyde dehydrogenase
LADAIALVGSETLLGREVREVFGASELGERLRLVADKDDETGTLTEIGGAPAFLTNLSLDALEDATIVILAGSAEAARAAESANAEAAFIDLTGALEDSPTARVRAPLAEDGDYRADDMSCFVVAHPAAVAIAILLRQLNTTWAIRRSVVQIFEPASERGSAGLDELQQQVVSMLSFKPVPKDVFGAQVAFSMISKLGEDAVPQITSLEERIEKHLATLLDRSGDIPMPSFRVIQAPVFHGYTMSFWVEFADAPSPLDVEETLTAAGIDVRTEDVTAPDNIGVAGQSGISVGSIAADRNNGDALWIWLAADNLRLTAENAARLAQELS